jgi:hypothetical protein
VEECTISCAWWIRVTAGTEGARRGKKEKGEKSKIDNNENWRPKGQYRIILMGCSFFCSH